MSINRMLKADLKDEQMAQRDYRKLAGELKKKGKKKDAKTVIGIAKQEKGHYKKLSKIKKSL